jgi:hypothetical protein
VKKERGILRDIIRSKKRDRQRKRRLIEDLHLMLDDNEYIRIY